MSVVNKKVFILGAGQIGEACALRLIPESPESIVIHCLTKEETNLAIKNIKQAYPKSAVKLYSSWGNALVTKGLLLVDKKDLTTNPKRSKELINYYYGYLSEKLIRNSSLYFLLKKWQPDIIIDAINTATVVGYQDDPYSLPRKLIKQDLDTKVNWKGSVENLLATSIIPSLIRFTQSLQQAIVDLKIESYVKISTTGLGGMGVNLIYTHGDLSEPGMSSGILGKVAAAGIMHQLFWSLSHTPGINIKVIVPAALVGWQGVHFGKFRSHGNPISLIDNPKKQSLKFGEALKDYSCDRRGLNNYFEMPYVDSGENSAYSLGEMTAITALGQMECITREEVAQAAFEAINGSTRHDLLTLMDHASMGPSFLAAIQRQEILNSMKQMSTEKGIPSIATNNLGPTVSKHLYELYLIHQVSGKSFDKCLSLNPKIITQKLEALIDSDSRIRSHILSLGLPILLEKNNLIIGDYHLVPKEHEADIVTEDNIEKWSQSGWIDLRQKQVAYWQKWLRKVKKNIDSLKKNTHVLPLDRNWQHLKDEDCGEILAYIYILQNGERRTNF